MEVSLPGALAAEAAATVGANIHGQYLHIHSTLGYPSAHASSEVKEALEMAYQEQAEQRQRRWQEEL